MGLEPFFYLRCIIIDSLYPIIEPVVKSFDCELWGIDFRAFEKSALLRVYVDKSDGVTLDDCSDISYQISGVLDVENPISTQYTLEVSSPGVERPLLNADHFRRFIGEKAKVRLKWSVNNQRNFVGKIHAVTDEMISLQLDDEIVELPLDGLARGKLLVDFSTIQGTRQ